VRNEGGMVGRCGAVWGVPTGKGRWNLNFSTYLCTNSTHTHTHKCIAPLHAAAHNNNNHIPRHFRIWPAGRRRCRCTHRPPRSAGPCSDPNYNTIVMMDRMFRRNANRTLFGRWTAARRFSSTWYYVLSRIIRVAPFRWQTTPINIIWVRCLWLYDYV